MKVMSYNILCKGSPRSRYWTNRKELVAGLIRSIKPDTFGLQEAHIRWMNFFKSAFPEYGFVGAGREDGKQKGEYAPVFYRKDCFDLLSHGTFWLSDTPEVPGKGWDADWERICTWAVLCEKDTGKTVAHMNTHLDHKGLEAQKNGALLIAEKAALLP